MKLTALANNQKTERDWYLINAEKLILGRLATRIAELLLGKHKTNFDPSRDRGDFVVVINIAKIKITGNKVEQKKYYRHSGYPGGIKERSLKAMLENDPTQVLTFAVRGMIPKNRLQKVRMKRLKLYADAEHKHQAQKLQELKIER